MPGVGSGRPFSSRRTWVIDVVLMFTTFIIGIVAAGALVIEVPRPVFTTVVVGLVLVATGSVVARFVTRPDHLKALQSHQILEIADRSLVYLRRGLDDETAQAVCRLALEETEAAAVAITDTEQVLGFAGIGEDHHEVGGPILTRATREAIETNEHRILSTRDEIGCPRAGCLLRAAIVVPLQIRNEPVGTLKFYYTTPRLLNETQVTMVEGLARLLSTQLELSELERQTALACRMELKALQAQINPHFLFNTINTIASLIRTDPPRARDLLREFARFYRRTLEENEELVPLERELEYARSYLVFEHARFGDRVQVTEEIDAEAMQVLVPAFIVQPLVENCVQHGMRADEPLHISVSARVENGTLVLAVADDGVGIAPSVLPRILEAGYGKGLGIALKNVDDRLRGRFSTGSGLTVASEEGVGTTVTATLALADTPTGEGDDA
ncbi:MAG: sensor histidine kinase [Actinobacteria bacterium HGW-Actinobacteria-1]|jgi:two-component system sensor histidine kinase LytS|nr:MAG: sensor histidine kinase [Actinobacteria bacterium HGW-Actinobacteria-1]